MNKVIKFLKNEYKIISTLIYTAGVFGVVFEFANFKREYFWLGVKCATFISAIFLFIDWINYSRQENYKKLSQDLEIENRRLLNQATIDRRELEEYFLLWVHQIKTPIAASQLLVAEVADRQLKQQLEQEIFKIDSYTNLVLQYLRLESFHDDLVLKQVQIEDLVKEIIRKYALFFIQKGLNVNLHDLDKEIVTDKKWLLVVIEQIISNCLKYTKEGGLEIYMEGQELCIKDTGIGIKNSDVLRVFERGFSGYNGRLTQQSSGLGLYLSKKISEELGHQIRIESEVGKGTTVRIQFAQVNLVLE